MDYTHVGAALVQVIYQLIHSLALVIWHTRRERSDKQTMGTHVKELHSRVNSPAGSFHGKMNIVFRSNTQLVDSSYQIWNEK